MKPRQWMQIAAVASAMGLTGGAIANDMDRTPGATNDNATSTAPSDDAASPASSSDRNGAPTLNHGGDLNNSADVNAGSNAGRSTGSAGISNDSTGTSTSSDTSSEDLNGQVQRGATQGSTMTSPRSDTSSDANAPQGGARYGSGSSATSIGGSDRLGSTNSDNFNTWMSDYASQHNGRITREEFLAQMGNRWDRLDAQHQGYLTPDQVEEILVITPEAASASPPRTGSDAQPGDMGPGNARGE